MGNGFQRIIYNLANTVPLILITALAWYLQFKTCYVPVILIITAIGVIILFVLCFFYWSKSYSVKNINVSKITSKDSWLATYVITYMFPFSYIVIPDYHIVSLMVIIAMLAIVIVSATMALPNILLFFMGYHFYEVETESTGVGDYILISRRKQIRNKADIKTVMRVSEKLLIDTKGEK